MYYVPKQQHLISLKINTKFRFNNNLVFINFNVTQSFVFMFDLCILFFGSTPRIYINRHFYAYPHMVQLFLPFEYPCNDFHIYIYIYGHTHTQTHALTHYLNTCLQSKFDILIHFEKSRMLSSNYLNVMAIQTFIYQNCHIIMRKWQHALLFTFCQKYIFM